MLRSVLAVVQLQRGVKHYAGKWEKNREESWRCAAQGQCAYPEKTRQPRGFEDDPRQERPCGILMT